MSRFARFCALVLLFAATSSFALNFKATINGAQETPPTGSAFTGQATITYATATRLLSWNIQHTIPSANIVGSHFHNAPPGVPGGVEVTIPFGTGASPFVGSATLTVAQEGMLLAGNLYVNIHTIAFGGGEIRGQVLQARSSLSDFDGAGKSDIFWRYSDGTNYIWEVNGASISGGVLAIENQGLLPLVDTTWNVVGIGDFNGDGKSDILFRKGDGTNYVWHVDGTTQSGGTYNILSQGLLPSVPPDWHVAGIGDFNGDGKSDILWRHAESGTNYVWHVDGSVITGGVLSIASQGLLPSVPGDWNVAGIGDFNGDGKSDIFWRKADGTNFVWNVDGATISGGLLSISSQGLLPGVDQTWNVAGIGDFDGNGKSDIFWRKNDGTNYIWLIDSSVITGGLVSIPNQALLPAVDNTWVVAGSGDYNGDGKSDILFRKDDGTNYVWHVDATSSAGGLFSIPSQGLLPAVNDMSWRVRNPAASPVQSAVNGARRSLDNLMQTVNTQGAALATAHVAAFMDPQLVGDGLNQTQEAAMFAEGLRGLSITAMPVKNIMGYNEIAGAVFVTFDVVTPTQTFGISEFDGGMGFRRDPTFKSLMWGNRRPGETGAYVEYLIDDNGTITGPSQRVNVDFRPPEGTVTSITVQGGPFVSPTSVVQQVGSRTFNSVQGDPTPAPPLTYYTDIFGLNVGASLTGRVAYDLVATPVSGPQVKFRFLSNNVTTQAINITSPTTHSIAAILGTTVTYNWTLPGYAIASLHLGAHVGTSVPPNPGTTCFVDEQDLPTGATSSSVTWPLTCDGQPVVSARVNLNTFGVNGERSSYGYGYQ